jgi:predicted component of type VI protein secretion system
MVSHLGDPAISTFHWNWNYESPEQRKTRPNMNAELIPLGPLQHNGHVSVTNFPFVIGRAADAKLRVDDRWSSRHHCEIDEVDGTLIVRDLASSNGTLVNGKTVCTSPLLPGDELTVGISIFKVSYQRNPLKAVPPVIHALPCGPHEAERSRRSDSADNPRSTHLKFGGTRESIANLTTGFDRHLNSSPTT